MFSIIEHFLAWPMLGICWMPLNIMLFGFFHAFQLNIIAQREQRLTVTACAVTGCQHLHQRGRKQEATVKEIMKEILLRWTVPLFRPLYKIHFKCRRLQVNKIFIALNQSFFLNEYLKGKVALCVRHTVKKVFVTGLILFLLYTL